MVPTLWNYVKKKFKKKTNTINTQIHNNKHPDRELFWLLTWIYKYQIKHFFIKYEPLLCTLCTSKNVKIHSLSGVFIWSKSLGLLLLRCRCIKYRNKIFSLNIPLTSSRAIYNEHVLCLFLSTLSLFRYSSRLTSKASYFNWHATVLNLHL